MWFYALRYVNSMLSWFDDITIHGFDNTCPTSCAPGTEIFLDPGAPFMPQARVMHEMGHVAELLGSLNQTLDRTALDYTFGGSGGWTITSREWNGATFTEAVATFFGDVAIYWYANPAPHTCVSAGACAGNNTNNIEYTPLQSGGACPGDGLGSREPVAVMRYLRDLYDSTDGDEPNSGITHVPFGSFFDTLYAYPANSNNHGRDELGVSAEGHSVYDFAYWFQDEQIAGADSEDEEELRNDNCIPSGF